jgi:hypothetical protein
MARRNAYSSPIHAATEWIERQLTFFEATDRPIHPPNELSGQRLPTKSENRFARLIGDPRQQSVDEFLRRLAIATPGGRPCIHRLASAAA